MVSLSCAVGGQDLALAEHTVSTPPEAGAGFVASVCQRLAAQCPRWGLV